MFHQNKQENRERERHGTPLTGELMQETGTRLTAVAKQLPVQAGAVEQAVHREDPQYI